MVGQLDELIPDGQGTDNPLACDFCKQDLAAAEPIMRIRHCIVARNPRDLDGANLQPVHGYSDFIMCLRCCATLSREIIPSVDGRDMWPTL